MATTNSATSIWPGHMTWGSLIAIADCHAKTSFHMLLPTKIETGHTEWCRPRTITSKKPQTFCIQEERRQWQLYRAVFAGNHERQTVGRTTLGSYIRRANCSDCLPPPAKRTCEMASSFGGKRTCVDQ